MLMPSKSILMSHDRKEKQRRVTFFDFKGLMAPVFTCFNNDEKCSLNIENIDKYAAYLKKSHIKGVLVNSITGEGPTMNLSERKTNAEKWWQAAIKYDLICVIQIGGASLPDVLLMAEHAEALGVHAVLCLPELYYKPQTVEMLVGYCRIVSKHCMSRPFLYYHIPRYTGVDRKFFHNQEFYNYANHFAATVDMKTFCREAEKTIPYFYGIQFSSADLEMGFNCLREGRVILLGFDTLLACGLILGFDSALMIVLNILPDLGWEIMEAIHNNNLAVAREKQMRLNDAINVRMMKKAEKGGMIAVMKNWFNEEYGATFSAGPSRKFQFP